MEEIPFVMGGEQRPPFTIENYFCELLGNHSTGVLTPPSQATQKLNVSRRY